MSEQIDITKRDVAGIMLINAMAAATKSEDLRAMYNPVDGHVEVELKINGHVVPLIPALENAYEQLRSKQVELAMALAEEAVCGAGLDGIYKMMANFKLELRKKLQEQFPNVDPDA